MKLLILLALTISLTFCSNKQNETTQKNSTNTKVDSVKQTGNDSLAKLQQKGDSLKQLLELDMAVLTTIQAENRITLDSGNNYKVKNGRVIELNLGGMNISKLPESIGKLDSLKGLFIMYNKNVTSIPVSIWNLKKLERFYFDNCSITDIPEIPSGDYNLYDLRGDKNQLTSLPIGMNNLKELTTLNLSSNRIDTLVSLIELSKLVTINVSENNISETDIFLKLPLSIKYLSLNNNQISEVTDDIRNFTKLEFLSLNNNKISSFPLLSEKLLSAKIDVGYNNLHYVDEELSKTFDESNQYWRVTQEGGIDSIYNDIYESIPHSVKVMDLFLNNLTQLEDCDIEDNSQSKSLEPSEEEGPSAAEVFTTKNGSFNCDDDALFTHFFADSTIIDESPAPYYFYTGNSWQQYEGNVYAGMSVSDLKEALGLPLFEKGNFVVYGQIHPNDPGDMTPKTFFRSTIFYVEDEVVKYLFLRYYMDC